MSASEDGEVGANATDDNWLSWCRGLTQVDSDSVGAAAVAALDVRLDAVTSSTVVDVILAWELRQRSFRGVSAIVVRPVRL